ncbi:hypothetical protein E8E95_14690 [Pseudomonas sp. BN414]|uniref:hypothetical protein n=1 Tax=Pseudomonas sp. BN414 TaxID=2567888 RepID=UPI002456368F|nr:hypothetical protein [Pseudomonas sp. BN414]MDH4567928.1 hypothetical protein [Pseudomonas sp. BN414]
MNVVMANQPNLLAYLKRELEFEFSNGPVDLRRVRNYVSSPRLFDFYAKGIELPGMIEAGDTYLDRRTMLADRSQKTFALSYADWVQHQPRVEVVGNFAARDSSIMNIQVWPYAPAELDEFQMAIAVALAYTKRELDAESRISSAIDDVISAYGFFTDEF